MGTSGGADIAFPSTFKNLQDEVIAELRLEEGDRSRVKDVINRAYAKAALDTEAVQTFGTATLTAGTTTYSLPTQVARVKWLRVKPAGGDGFGPPLEQVSIETILRYEAGDLQATSGAPYVFTVIGKDEIEVWPAAASSLDEMFFWYVALPTALSADGDLLELQEPYGSNLCKYGACAEMRPLMVGTPDFDYRTLYNNEVAAYRVHLSRSHGAQTRQFDNPGFPRIPVPSSADLGN